MARVCVFELSLFVFDIRKCATAYFLSVHVSELSLKRHSDFGCNTQCAQIRNKLTPSVHGFDSDQEAANLLHEFLKVKAVIGEEIWRRHNSLLQTPPNPEKFSIDDPDDLLSTFIWYMCTRSRYHAEYHGLDAVWSEWLAMSHLKPGNGWQTGGRLRADKGQLMAEFKIQLSKRVRNPPAVGKSKENNWNLGIKAWFEFLVKAAALQGVHRSDLEMTSQGNPPI